MQWQGCYLTGCLIERWLLTSCQLDDAQLQDIQLNYWTVQDTLMTHLTMRTANARFQLAWLHYPAVSVENSELIRQVMGSCVLKECQYQAIQSDTVVWSQCQLEQVDFRHQPLENSNFHKAH